MSNEIGTKKLSFNIQGEFITKLAREWFYSGKKSYDEVLEMLMSSPDISEVQSRRYAEDILLGRAALKGNTADGSYHLEIYGPGEEQKLPSCQNIWKEIEKRKQAEKKLEKMEEQWNVAMEYISDGEQREIRKILGIETNEDKQKAQVDSFIERMMDENTYATEDYGWLAPNGTFYAVEWGEHQEWAQSYIEKNFPDTRENDIIDIQMKSHTGLIGAGDYLVERGWVLLHADTIHEFLCWDKDFNVWINESLVKDYVEKELYHVFNTVGAKRTIHSPGSGKFTISGGTYGNQIDIEAETKEIIKDIKNSKMITREPKYFIKVTGSNNGIGKNYVDVNISKQKLWYIRKNKIVFSSDIVTGDPTTGHSTPTGMYYVEFKKTDYTMRKYNAHVNYWMPIDTGTGVGLHDASWRGSFGGEIYHGNGSHGCINMPTSKASVLYHMLPVNTPVIVH